MSAWTHDAGDESDTGGAAQKRRDAVESEVQACLEQEAGENGDVVLLPLQDCDTDLQKKQRKLEESYRWALQSSAASWLLKVDDDVVFVNTCRLEAYLSSLGQQLRTVVGRTWQQSLVESFGYVVSRDVAAEVVHVDMDKAKDQGEDANLGISLTKKLGESSLATDLTWVSAAGFVNDAAVWVGTQEVARDPNTKKKGRAGVVTRHGQKKRARAAARRTRLVPARPADVAKRKMAGICL